MTVYDQIIIFLISKSYLLDISPGLDPPQELNSMLGLAQLLDLVADDQRKFRHLIDDMALAEDEGWHTGCGNGRGQSVTSLVDVDATVPTAPWLGGGEHATSATHVTESTLAGTVGTATTYTRNTGDSTTSTPGLGRSLVT